MNPIVRVTAAIGAAALGFAAAAQAQSYPNRPAAFAKMPRLVTWRCGTNQKEEER